MKSGIVMAAIGLLFAMFVIHQVALAQPATSPQPQSKAQSKPEPKVQSKAIASAVDERAQIEKAAIKAIASNWYPPKCNPATGPVIVRIKLDMQGSVHEKYMVKSSNVSIFDQSAMNAIEYQSKAFPALRSIYPDGNLDICFDGNIYHSGAVTLRAVTSGDLSKDADKQLGEGTSKVTDKQLGEGTSKVTGRVVGTRGKPVEETHSK